MLRKTLFLFAVSIIFITTEIESYPKEYEGKEAGSVNNNAADKEKKEELNIRGTYHSRSWDEFLNESAQISEEEKRYPAKLTITPKTMREAVKEYYLPGVAEGVNIVIDYYEKVETWDDKPLHKYNLDLAPKADDKAVKLIWKKEF